MGFDGMGWNGKGCAVRCDAMLCFVVKSREAFHQRSAAQRSAAYS